MKRKAALGIALMWALLVAPGCRKPAPTAAPSPPPQGQAQAAPKQQPPVQPAQPAPQPSGGGGGGGGGVMAVRKAAQRPINANDLKQLVTFYQTYETENGRGPANAQEFISYIQRDAGKLAKEIQEGYLIVYYGVRLSQLPAGASNTVLAYEKAIGESGEGWVAMADGSAHRVNPQRFATLAKPGR